MNMEAEQGTPTATETEIDEIVDDPSDSVLADKLDMVLQRLNEWAPKLDKIIELTTPVEPESPSEDNTDDSETSNDSSDSSDSDTSETAEEIENALNL